MNANELADLLAASNDPDIRRAVAMLRQQQAEIEALKAAKIRAYNNGVEDGRKPDTNNKPVAWMLADREKEHIRSIMAVQHDFVPEGCVEIPLYTHPVKEHDIGISHAIGFDDGFKAGMQRAVEMNVVKELTDEEIKLEAKYFCHSYHSENPERLVLFARAILRKAQENDN